MSRKNKTESGSFPSFLSLLTAILICAVGGLVSCHNDDDELDITVRLNQTEISYGSDDVWEGVALNNPFQSQYLVFSHEGEASPFGPVWEGFTPARIAGNTLPSGESWAENQFMIMPGGGMGGIGTPYIVASWNNQENETTPPTARSCRIHYSSSMAGEHYSFRPLNVYVSNTCQAYHTMLEGNDSRQAFSDNDYLTLIAHGVHPDGTEFAVPFNLAGADSGGVLYVCDNWEFFSLDGLGECVEIYFTMESSRNDEWGMTAPAYFAIDRLTIRAKLPGK